MPTDTICAISTAVGSSAISIIRISGAEAIKIVNHIFSGPNLQTCPSHTINYGFIIDNEIKIDEVLVSIMKSPKTFTCEDIVEINCHGGIASTNKVLELLLLNGARLAYPGEFTKRAFLNGRIDLVKAEAISDLIVAKTDSSRSLAMNQITGKLSELIKDIKQKIIKIRANIEVNIDYPEYEDELVITHEILNNYLNDIKKSLQKLLETAVNGQIVKNGINVVLIGKPNVGKSSILNKLLNEEKAIVTDIAGTTRDVIEGQFLLKGIVINIVDTAGIRSTTDVVEKLGVQKSLEQISRADLIIYIVANDDEISEEELKFIQENSPKKHIIAINKSDLTAKISLKKLSAPHIVKTSTISQDGLEDLKLKIIELFNLSEIDTKEATYVSNARHISLIKKSLKSLETAIKASKNLLPIDLIAIDIEETWTHLSEIIGETYKEELLDELFSKFCLGK